MRPVPEVRTSWAGTRRIAPEGRPTVATVSLLVLCYRAVLEVTGEPASTRS
jgi:hypothetical protein